MALVEGDGETGEASAAGIRPPDRVVRKVSIIILNWNRRDDTLECLRSVQRIDYPNFETIVVAADGSSVEPERAVQEVQIEESDPEAEATETARDDVQRRVVPAEGRRRVSSAGRG